MSAAGLDQGAVALCHLFAKPDLCVKHTAPNTPLEEGFGNGGFLTYGDVLNM